MNKLMVMALVLVCCLLIGCSKGNVISGSTVVDVNEEQAKTTKSLDTSDEVSDGEEEDDTSDVLGDVEEPDYSEEAGTCTKDSVGVVRVFEEDGTKKVYRSECLGGILVEYACTQNGQLDTQMNRCPGDCVVGDDYFGRCA